MHPSAPGPQGPGFLFTIRTGLGPRPLLQLFVLGGVIALSVLAFLEITAAMRQAGLTPGFAFLWQKANFEIGESAIAYAAGDSYGRALLAGLANTAKVAFWGCVLSSILGLVVALLGLAGNPLLRRIVRAYIDLIRGTPLLLQLFAWTTLFQSFPAVRQAVSLFGLAYFSNRGAVLPAIGLGDRPASLWLPGFALLAILAFLGGRPLLRGRRQATALTLIFTLAVLLLAVGFLSLLGEGPTLDLPAKGGFNIRGGLALTPEFASLLTGLVVNASATVAEIIRSGIESVRPGQWEAAKALGLSRSQTLRLVVWPQALRVIIPLMTSSYLDLTKNSSLAVAIGYPDLVSVTNTTANTTGQAVEAIFLIMILYLTLNLATSLLMNRFHRRVALRGGLER